MVASNDFYFVLPFPHDESGSGVEPIRLMRRTSASRGLGKRGRFDPHQDTVAGKGKGSFDSLRNSTSE